MPFVADLYGALRIDVCEMVRTLIQRHRSRFAPLTEAEAACTIWNTVSSEAMARAAMQLIRMAQLDSPSGIDLPGLDLQHRLHRHRHPVWYFPLNRKAWAPNPLFCLANLTDAAVPWLFCHFPIQFQWVLNVDFWYTQFSLKFNPSSSKSNSDQP